MKIDWDSEEAKGCDYCLYEKDHNQYRFYNVMPIIESNGNWSYSDNYFGYPLANSWSLHERQNKESEIPEGAKYKNKSTEALAVYYKEKNGSLMYWHGKGLKWLGSYHNWSWAFENLTEIKQEKEMKENIYTKEMYNRGETINSEMTAMYKDKKVLIRLCCDELNNVVFRFEGAWLTVHVDEIKPVDTRTDKEKALDDLVAGFNKNNFGTYINDMDLASIVNIAFEAGITFTRDK